MNDALNGLSPSIRRLGRVCLLLALVLLACAIPLRCVGKALLVGAVSAGSGAVLGLLLALITRTRRVWLIYACLLFAALTLRPLWIGWPSAGESDVHLWRNAPALFYNYFDALRVGLYMLAAPFPFAALGHHAPDTKQNGQD